MPSATQETKIENLRIHAQAKTKVHTVVDFIEQKAKIRPSLSEAISIMADHFLATSKAA